MVHILCRNVQTVIPHCLEGGTTFYFLHLSDIPGTFYIQN